LFGTQYIMGGKLCSKTRCCIKKIYKRLDRIIVCSSPNVVSMNMVLAKNDKRVEFFAKWRFNFRGPG